MMRFVDEKQNKAFDDIADAVNDIRCPGPCGPDCPLHPTVRIETESTIKYGHMCDPDYYNSHPVTVATALGLKIRHDARPTPADETTYIAVIKSSAVRDVQFCTNADLEPTDDGAWPDLEDAEIYLGFFKGETARVDAAKYASTVPENIRLIPVPQKGDA